MPPINVYKVIFAKNRVISCRNAGASASMTTAYHYEHDKGYLIYAIIKAETEADALAIADCIIKDVTEKTLGSDFVV